MHTKHIKMALEAGLHVFVDKPLGINVEECQSTEKVVAGHSEEILSYLKNYLATT